MIKGTSASAGVTIISLAKVLFMFYGISMDWDFAVERNRERMLGAVLGLFTLIGLVEGGMVERLSQQVYRKVLGKVKAAEAAVRRLIIVAARDIVVEPRPKRPAPKRPINSNKGQAKGSSEGESRKSRPPSFPLCDPQRRSDAGQPRRRRRKYTGPEPRIRVLEYDPRIPWFLRGPDPTPAPAPVLQKIAVVKDGTVSARRLCRRLFAIVRALTNMEREAERYARFLAQPVEDRRPRRERALRYGWPPGRRIKPTHEIDEILKECHWLIRELPAPDTS
jgi:hypothetical protein